MKHKDYEVEANYKATKKNIEEIINNIDTTEEEQTYINAKYIYEVDIDDNELYIKRFTHSQYASKYGEGTLLDLLERLE